jgi:DNA sulfur modification protein DndC
MSRPQESERSSHKRREGLTRQALDACLERIRSQYLADGRPWVIGYSGGKDSTCVLQLAWTALSALPAEKLTKRVYVVASDTFVESPAVERRLTDVLDRIGAGAKQTGLPLEAHKVCPTVDQSFWVNLIGRGYPAPYNSFRWCTDRMKIEPATAFIRAKVAQYGEVLILLGARKTESSTRGQMMNSRRELGDCLSRHSSLPNAWVFTPIEDWSTDDVWTYLTSSSPPWGGDNQELITMYLNAQAGECPLVIDKSTPSCGGGRFGCWVCTVVDRDRTMEAMIDNGERWLQPLLDLRNWLADTKEPSAKPKIREARRRTGRIEFYGPPGEEKVRWGPYKLSFRKQILERLLLAQEEVRKSGPDPKVDLIREDELHRIRQIWLHEEGDWEDSLPSIHENATGQRLPWVEDDWSGMGGAEKRVLDEVSLECGVPQGLLLELMDVEREYHGMSRRAGVYQNLERVLKKDWHSLEEARASLSADDNAAVAEDSDAH